MIVNFRRPPPPPALTIMNSTVTTVESFRFLGTTISQDLKWDVHIESIVKKDPAEVVLSLPAEEVQPATGAAETVLLCHHWICPLHFNTCLVQLSNQIWPQKTTEGSRDCWVNHWYNPPPLTKNCTYPEWAKVLAKSLWTPDISTLPLWTVTVWSMLQSSDTRKASHRNSFFPQAIHLMNIWTLNNKHETHNTIIDLFS